MTTKFGRETVPADNPEMQKEMAEHGITRTLVECFHYGDFRYSNLKDALAQAKRDRLRQ